MVIRIYWASVSGNRKVNSDQTRLKNLVDMLKLDSVWIDITTDPVIKDTMRRECGKPTAMPPQIFNESVYLGTVDEFDESVECGNEKVWLKLTTNNESDNAVDEVKPDDGAMEQSNNKPKVLEEKIENRITHTVKREVELAPPKKLSTKIFNKFENGNEENNDVTKREAKVISITKQVNESTQKKVTIDEERKRRLLGLPPLNGEENGAAESKPAVVTATSEAVEIKTFEFINKEINNKVENTN